LSIRLSSAHHENPLCPVFLRVATAAFASKDQPVIGLSLDTLKEERWQHDRDTFIVAAEKLGPQ
jgi:D-xylose transport system substrate-binding protein